MKSWLDAAEELIAQCRASDAKTREELEAAGEEIPAFLEECARKRDDLIRERVRLAYVRVLEAFAEVEPKGPLH